MLICYYLLLFSTNWPTFAARNFALRQEDFDDQNRGYPSITANVLHERTLLHSGNQFSPSDDNIDESDERDNQLEPLKEINYNPESFDQILKAAIDRPNLEYDPNQQRELAVFQLSSRNFDRNWERHVATASQDARFKSAGDDDGEEMFHLMQSPCIKFDRIYAAISSTERLPKQIFTGNSTWWLRANFRIGPDSGVGLHFVDGNSENRIIDSLKDGSLKFYGEMFNSTQRLSLNYASHNPGHGQIFVVNYLANKTTTPTPQFEFADEVWECRFQDKSQLSKQKLVAMSIQKLDGLVIILTGEVWTIEGDQDVHRLRRKLRPLCRYERLYEIENLESHEALRLLLVGFDRSGNGAGMVDVEHFDFIHTTKGIHRPPQPYPPSFADRNGGGPIEVAICDESAGKHLLECWLDCSTIFSQTSVTWYYKNDTTGRRLQKIKNATGMYRLAVWHLGGHNVQLGDGFFCFVSNDYGTVQRSFKIATKMSSPIDGRNQNQISPKTDLTIWQAFAFFLAGAAAALLAGSILYVAVFFYRRRQVDYIVREETSSRSVSPHVSYSLVRRANASADEFAEDAIGI